jgi:AcrR family transcriptional regulator
LAAVATSDHTSKGGSLRDEQKRLTRRLLIEGAVTAFARKGYAATTIEDIVAEANASRATFYLHFKSKADVVLVVARTLGRRWRELYLELTSGERPSRKDLYEWIGSMIDNYATNRGSLEALDQAEAIEPEVAAVRLDNHKESIAVIAESIRRWYGCGEEEARVRAALLLVQLDRFLYAWIVSGIPFDRERALGTLTDLWLLMLGLSETQSSQSGDGQVDSSLDIA